MREFPIVYVRGYAGTQSEVEDTVADPYMGLNKGSTMIRQLWTRDVARHVFESPLIRLMKDHGYRDVFHDGAEPPIGERVPRKSIWIYRYYEPVSKALGTGVRPEIEDYADGLDRFLETVRDHVCGTADDTDPTVQTARRRFRVHLVAHSLGGLVVRCYLQNRWYVHHADRVEQDLEPGNAKPPVDRVFTYATPHGGIDFRLVGNVPGFLHVNNVENFNEDRMRAYLRISRPDRPVNSLDGKFDPARMFCLVGTDSRDYHAAAGLSRLAVGPMSDGLVQIQNAVCARSPRAFVHRSHSGHYGIVNSEEGYQNLRRFLFGDVRVDALLECGDLTFPPEVEKARAEDRDVQASYHVEVVARVRSVRWDLHRRTVGEQSARFVPYGRMVKAAAKPLHLATTFLMHAAAVKHAQVLGFSLDIGVLVPEYVVERRWWPDDHHEGGYLFREKVNLEMIRAGGEPPKLLWGLDSRTPNRVRPQNVADRERQSARRYTFRIPLAQKTRPGFTGALVLRTRAET